MITKLILKTTAQNMLLWDRMHACESMSHKPIQSHCCREFEWPFEYRRLFTTTVRESLFQHCKRGPSGAPKIKIEWILNRLIWGPSDRSFHCWILNKIVISILFCIPYRTTTDQNYMALCPFNIFFLKWPPQ